MIRTAATVLVLAASATSMAQSDPAGFAHSTPGEVTWKASPSIPPGGESAIVYGNPGKPGLYATRVKLPGDYRIQPHTHPEERIYTVISGTFHVGFGETFDPARLHAFPAGSVLVIPANASHFHWMRSGEAIVQISGLGPSGIEYLDHADDPRK